MCIVSHLIFEYDCVSVSILDSQHVNATAIPVCAVSIWNYINCQVFEAGESASSVGIILPDGTATTVGKGTTEIAICQRHIEEPVKVSLHVRL